jgi:hypothetical protein
LVGNKKITIHKTEQKKLPEYERKWEWMNREDRASIIRKRNNRIEPGAKDDGQAER